DPYAAADEAEFFAVSSEHFFVDPAPLAEALPGWYGLLRAYYRQDPLARLTRAAGGMAPDDPRWNGKEPHEKPADRLALAHRRGRADGARAGARRGEDPPRTRAGGRPAVRPAAGPLGPGGRPARLRRVSVLRAGKPGRPERRNEVIVRPLLL